MRIIPPRIHLKYDPCADFALRWPTWVTHLVALATSDEIFIECERLVLIDMSAYSYDPWFAMAHVVAHLDLHLGLLDDAITPDQESEANTLAAIRLDREGYR